MHRKRALSPVSVFYLLFEALDKPGNRLNPVGSKSGVIISPARVFL
jgi:hypothetical protein